jgi:hypothetical protein
MKQEEHTTTPGRSIHHREQWEKHHYRLFNLGIGTIMIILGMVLLF